MHGYIYIYILYITIDLAVACTDPKKKQFMFPSNFAAPVFFHFSAAWMRVYKPKTEILVDSWSIPYEKNIKKMKKNDRILTQGRRLRTDR